MNKQPEALKTADELEANMLAVANGKMKPGKMPIEPICRAYSELRRLHRVELAYQVWSNKTEWVQGTGDGSELGMHIADVLKQRIERLQLSNTELLKALEMCRDAAGNPEKIYQITKPLCKSNRRNFMKLVQILEGNDQVLPTDYCRPLYIDVSGESCDREGFPKNYVKWAPVNLVIPKYFQTLKVDSLRQEGYAFEFARGKIPDSHKLDIRMYPKVAPKEKNA